jgi:DNA-binding NarL/FixJ family response regulator
MRIIFADHHPHSGWAIQQLFDEESQIDLIGLVANAQSLLTLAEDQPADLVLLDRELPGLPIEEMIARLHSLEPRPIVVVMSSESEYSRKLLKAGADAFMSKADQSDWLLDTLNKYARQFKMKEDVDQNKKF